MDQYLPDEIKSYCTQMSSKEEPLLIELEKRTFAEMENPRMISGSQVGRLLQTLILARRARKVLEIGTFTGFATLQMAAALPPDGRVHTCDLNPVALNLAREFFKLSPFGNRIQIHEGPALITLTQFSPHSFEFAFIDANKNSYPDYYQQTMTLLVSGGIIVLDNMLWSGKVLNPEDEDSKALRSTAELIQKDYRVRNVLLPVRDGLMVVYKS